MKNTMKVLVVSFLVVGAGAFASGFKCEGSEYSVKLFNKLDATRTPAVLVVSVNRDGIGTLITAKGSEISKTNRLNTVRYTVDAAEAFAKQAILQISFKEGRETLEEGEVVSGQLILVQEDGSREVTDLECSRYKKN